MTWISNDVQKQVETACSYKATGKNMGQFNTQGGTAAHSLGSFMVSSHPTWDWKDGGSMKQNKNKKTNPNTIPVVSSKYCQPLLNQFLARSQQSTSRSSADRVPWAEDGEITLGMQSNHTRAEQSTSTLPVDLWSIQMILISLTKTTEALSTQRQQVAYRTVMSHSSDLIGWWHHNDPRTIH